MAFFSRRPLTLPTPDEALPGRATPLRISARHAVLDAPLDGPFPEQFLVALFGLGCFWGAERKFWQQPGVVLDGGRVCRRRHAEPDVRGGVLRHDRSHRGGARRVRPDARSRTTQLLRVFWENHDPTQGMRQGNDVGTQYRSAIYCHRRATAATPRRGVARRVPARAARGGLRRRSPPRSADAPAFYFAEDYHQQYLAKNPGGYCGLGGTNVSCPIGLDLPADARP